MKVNKIRIMRLINLTLKIFFFFGLFQLHFRDVCTCISEYDLIRFSFIFLFLYEKLLFLIINDITTHDLLHNFNNSEFFYT